jgi:glycerol-1-phosphate dehydrogenase [NAD(P)+]
MVTHMPVVIGEEAVDAFLAFCRERGLEQFALVADANTYRALGERVELALRGAGCDVLTVIVQGDDIGADKDAVYQVLLALDKAPRTFVAVGSGTITDIARFVSHRSNADFISLPTAASVDGFTSIGAPMIIDGAKITVNAQGPIGVFADIDVLCAAPRPMIAAGFGDLVAKLTSVADWELGALLWDEPFDAEIAARARRAAWDCARQVDSVAAGECDGVRALMAGLIESGFCMLDFGETRPASGYEHQLSHLWEMTLLREGRHSILHGSKVGVGVLASARVYDALRQVSPEEARQRAAAAMLPDRDADIAQIRGCYRGAADAVIYHNAPMLDMTAAEYDEIKRRVAEGWDEVQRIAATVPPADEIAGWLRRVGGPTDAAELGIEQDWYDTGLQCAHFYRPRFNGRKLARLLGVETFGT